MKFNKKQMIFPIIVSLLGISGCSNPSGNTEIPTFKDDYDSSWVPGENALKNASQPTIKNPKGECTVLNEIRRSQKRVGLPSKGEANILVVPINFKNDDVIQQELGEKIDITFSDEDLEGIKNQYFGTDPVSNEKLASVKKYYETSSYGKLNIDGVVSPVITMPDTYINYLLKAKNTGFESAYSNIIDYVYDYLFNVTQTYYLKDFDADNDNRVDAISLIVNYPYGLMFENQELNELSVAFLGPQNTYFESELLEPEKTKVNSFSIVSDFFRVRTQDKVDSHLAINNVGRMIGLDSYLDNTGNPATGMQRVPLGFKDMMSGAVGDHNAFSKYQLGWIEPQKFSANSIPSEGLEITIHDLSSSGDSILLYTGNQSMFGEYLLIDLYTPSGLNEYDSKNPFLYNENKSFSVRGVRVTKVDSRLVRGTNYNYSEYFGEPNFDELATLPNGKTSKYTYDYAYTNNSMNKYYNYGITSNNALVSYLTRDGSNRHMTSSFVEFSNKDLWKKGDVFGSDSSIEGFYKDFRFNGNGSKGDLLGINFEIKDFINNKAIIKLWRDK